MQNQGNQAQTASTQPEATRVFAPEVTYVIRQCQIVGIITPHPAPKENSTYPEIFVG